MDRFRWLVRILRHGNRTAQSIDQPAQIWQDRGSHQQSWFIGFRVITGDAVEDEVVGIIRLIVDLVVQLLGTANLFDALVRRCEQKLPRQIREELTVKRLIKAPIHSNGR